MAHQNNLIHLTPDKKELQNNLIHLTSDKKELQFWDRKLFVTLYQINKLTLTLLGRTKWNLEFCIFSSIVYRQKYRGRGVLSQLHQWDAKNLRQPGIDTDLPAAFHQYCSCHGWHRVSVIRIRPPDCHCLPVRWKNTIKKQERAYSTHTYPSEGSPDSKIVPLPPWLPCCREPSNRWWCSVLQGCWRITRGSELRTTQRNRLSAAFSSRQCLRGRARLGTASSALSRSAWLPRAPGSLTSWGALREEVPEKKQKPGCLALAVLRLQPPRPLPQSLNTQTQEPGSAFVFH